MRTTIRIVFPLPLNFHKAPSPEATSLTPGKRLWLATKIEILLCSVHVLQLRCNVKDFSSMNSLSISDRAQNFHYLQYAIFASHKQEILPEIKNLSLHYNSH